MTSTTTDRTVRSSVADRLGLLLGTLLAGGGAIALTTWTAGWLATPAVTIGGAETSGSARGIAAFRVTTRADLRLRAAGWRPVDVTLTLVPDPWLPRAEPVNVAIEVPGVPKKRLTVSGPTSLQVELPRLRGLRDAASLAVVVEDAGRAVEIRDVSARYPWTWAAGAVLSYSAVIGVIWGRTWRGTWRREMRRQQSVWPGSAGARALVLPVAALLVMIVRMPEAILAPQFWAEDGAVFFRDAWVAGAAAITSPYAGYFHLWPRLVAAAAATLPVPTVPLAFTVGAMVPVVLVALLVGSSRLEFSRGERLSLVLLLGLPPMPGEVLLNITNAQWMLGFTFVLLLVARPDARPVAVARDGALLAVAGLTGPFSMLFAPLYVARAFMTRARGPVIAAAIVLLTATIQTAALLSSRRFAIGEPTPVDMMLARIGSRLGAWVGLPVSEEAAFLVGGGLMGVGLLFVVALLVERAWVPAVFAACGWLVFASALLGVRNLAGSLTLGGERYFSLPLCLGLWGLVLARRVYPRLAPTVIAVALALTASLFSVPPLPDLAWREASACLAEQDKGCRVPINPEGWYVDVPARR